MTMGDGRRPLGEILVLGGGGFGGGEPGPLDDHLLELATRRAADHGRPGRPRIAFVPTASGDPVSYVELFEHAYGSRAETTDVSLFRRDGSDLAAALLAVDAVFVGGGSTLNLLALWRLHGLDTAMADALAAGVVLAGVSAGMNCWFDASVTDSHGPLSGLSDGLGFLAGSACPHYDGEVDRRPTYLGLVASGALPAGVAVQDGVALHYRDGELHEAVTERADGCAFRVTRDGDRAVETPIPVRHLGS